MDKDVLLRALQREKRARKHAEDILEEKSLELFKINQELEERVRLRTQELEKAKKIAEESNAAKNEFLAKLSHEIRTPVSGIIGFTEELIEKNLKLDIKENFDNILSCSSILLHLLDEVFDFYKIEQFDFKQEPMFTPTKKFFLEIKSILSIHLKNKPIDFKNDISTTVPENIVVDQKRLKQILLNILMNSIKYTESGFVSLHVEARNNFLCIDIEDSGRGIADHIKGKVFDLFTQEDSRSGGLGLGLNIVKSLIDLLKGEIDFSSELGKGTVFKLRIPYTEVNNLILEESEKIILHKKISVLIVEDNAINQKIVSSQIRSIAKKVKICESIASAQQALNEESYDLILLDYLLPDGNGLDFMKSFNILKSKGIIKDKTKVVVLTASGVSKVKEGMTSAGVDLFLTKPLRKNDLLNQILKLFPQ